MTVKSSNSSTGEPFAGAQVKAGRHSRVMAEFRQGIGLPDWRMDAEELETATFRKPLSRRRRENSRSLRPERRFFDLHCDIGSVPGKSFIADTVEYVRQGRKSNFDKLGDKGIWRDATVGY